MSDEKVPGGPPPDTQPPPYTPGVQGGAPPPAGGYPPQAGGYPPTAGGYPPPAGGYPNAYPQAPGYTQQTTVVLQQPGGAQPGSLVRYHTAPAFIVCQHCNATVTTSVSYESGLLTWIAVGVICLFGCWLGCCLIPLCIDGCKDAVHTCPNCKQLNGKYSQIS